MAATVSVCIPAFEQTEYLERTLASVAAQDLRPLEVIITDDSRTDAVRDLVRTMEPTIGAPVIYRRNDPALGPPRNWNSAIDLASGDLVKIMHHDEWFIGPHALGEFVAAITESDADLAFSGTDVHAVAEDRRWTLLPGPEEVGRVLDRPPLLLLANIIGAPSATIMRREVKLRYDPALTFLVDVDLYMRVIDAGLKVRYIDRVLIGSVSDAGHNVTLASRNADVELREFILLYERWKDRITGPLHRRFRRMIFGMFVKYGVRSEAALKAIHPAWTGGGHYAVILRLARLYDWRQRLRGQEVRKT